MLVHHSCAIIGQDDVRGILEKVIALLLSSETSSSCLCGRMNLVECAWDLVKVLFMLQRSHLRLVCAKLNCMPLVYALVSSSDNVSYTCT